MGDTRHIHSRFGNSWATIIIFRNPKTSKSHSTSNDKIIEQNKMNKPCDLSC